MAFIKLNHTEVRNRMNKLKLRPTDLADQLGVNRQTVHYILYEGGVKYAGKLAKIFGCKDTDLLIHNLRR